MRVVELEAFPIPEVKGDQLPYTQLEDPYLKQTIEGILTNPPAVITDPNLSEVGLPFGDSYPGYDVGETGYELYQASVLHQRSFVIKHPDLPEKIMDEFGNTFECFTLKGCNFSNKSVIETATAANGFIAYGLQESASIRRIMRASECVRRLGISTEYILGLAEPKNLPSPAIDPRIDELNWQTRQDYKQDLVFNEFQSRAPEDQSFELLGELQHALGETAFYISLRVMDSPYRYSEILDKESKITRVIRTELGDEEFSNFINNTVPERIGINLAKLHAAGLVHGFPHAGNVSAEGALIDLDSVRGEPLDLGDEHISLKDVLSDLERFVGSVCGAVSNKSKEVDPIISSFLDAYIKQSIEISGADGEKRALQLAEMIRIRSDQAEGDDQFIPDDSAKHILDRLFREYFLNQLHPEIRTEEFRWKVVADWAETAELTFDEDIRAHIENNIHACVQEVLCDVMNEYRKSMDEDNAADLARDVMANGSTKTERWTGAFMAVRKSIMEFIGQNYDFSGANDDIETKQLKNGIAQRCVVDRGEYEWYAELAIQKWPDSEQQWVDERIASEIAFTHQVDILSDYALPMFVGDKENIVYGYYHPPLDDIRELIAGGEAKLKVVAVQIPLHFNFNLHHTVFINGRNCFGTGA